MSEQNVTKRQRQRQRREEKELAIIQYRAKQKKRRRIYFFSSIAGLAVILFVIILVVQQNSDSSSNDVATTDTTIISTTTTVISTTTTIGDTMPNYKPYTQDQYGQGECPPEEVPETPVIDFSDQPKLCLDLTKQYNAIFTTSEGVIKIKLDVTNTPGTANNFYVLAKYGYFNGTKLFRTDPSIAIIQGGAPHANSPSDPGPGYTILDEGDGFKYSPGDLVMARTSAPNSASGQFFFAVDQRTALLDGQGTYVTFGKTIEGLDVLENILALHEDDPTSNLGGGPSRDVIVEKVEIEEVT